MSTFELRDDDALFLDFDGTLVELADHPDRVSLPQNLASMLEAIRRRLSGALALVSGRPLDDVDRWLRPVRFAGAGLHGLELRRHPEGSTETLGPAVPSEALSEIHAAVVSIEGSWLEDKGRSIAIHYRAAPTAEPHCLAAAGRVAERFGLRVLRGKMVAEIKMPGADKGTAVLALMRTAPFLNRRPIFVGDDVTDEDGFAVATHLGGFGVRIGDGSTCAQIRLPDVGAALGWLARHAPAVVQRTMEARQP